MRQHPALVVRPSASEGIGRHRNCHSRYPRLYPTRYGKAQPLESASGSGYCRRVACKLEPQLNSWSGYIRDIQDDSRIDKCSQKIRRTRSIAVIALGVCTESRREPKSARERWREPAKERERVCYELVHKLYKQLYSGRTIGTPACTK